jgi:4-hydroxy-L-threonine phosphate dehydrogenase PdxA
MVKGLAEGSIYQRERPLMSGDAGMVEEVKATHDQGLIAAKTVDFYGTVSCTLGLPVICTSVDHGTVFDIAGQWMAEARGQVAARTLAGELASRVPEARGAAVAR